MSVLELARPELQALVPYSSARMEAAASAVMLNANESPWPPPGDAGQNLNRYPEPQPCALRARMAGLYGVCEEQVLLGRGSDEAIDLLVRAFCRPGQDAVMVCPPTFGMYAVCAGVQGAAVRRVPLDAAFALDVDAVLAACMAPVKLLFLCSPNNPTGGMVPLEVIGRLADALRGRALVIVDEAYVEFADQSSAAMLLSRHANLGVLRTLSKAWALAGARIGALLAQADVVALLRRIVPPYPLPTPCVDAAMRALGARGKQHMQERVAIIRRERERLRIALCRLPGVRGVLPTQANFLTVRFDDPATMYRILAAQGIIVRDVTRYPRLGDALRISVGTPRENARLLEVLQAGTNPLATTPPDIAAGRSRANGSRRALSGRR